MFSDDSESHHIRHGHQKVTSTEYQNCTVAYMSQCMSLNKCRTSCQSMGSASYRWFHDYGCCECIGVTCLNFGKGEALCLKCPLKEGSEEDEDDDVGMFVEYDLEKEEEDDSTMIHSENNEEDIDSETLQEVEHISKEKLVVQSDKVKERLPDKSVGLEGNSFGNLP